MYRGALTLVWLATLVPAGAGAAPDPAGAARALAHAPFVVAGDLCGAAGLASAAAIALAGDALALVDDNRLSRPVLRGVASGLVHRVALAASWIGTGALEGLRGEDIERLPEARATYLEAAPGVGRVDTLLDAGAALGLAAGDLASAPLLALLRAVGAGATADALELQRKEARVRALGPDPLPPLALADAPAR